MPGILPQLYNHLDAMLWRYATKSYDPSAKLDREILYAIQEILRLTPTTMGLQLWRFVITDNPEIRKQLFAHCHFPHNKTELGAHHMMTASHLVVFCRPREFQAAYIDQHIEHVAYERRQSISELHAYSANCIDGLMRTPTTCRLGWTPRFF